MTQYDKIDGEVEHLTILGQVAKSVVEPDIKGYIPSGKITGKFKKHYQYDFYDEVSVDVYEKGALLRNLGTAYEWYGKDKVQKCFEKAKILGQRSKGLNRMMR